MHDPSLSSIELFTGAGGLALGMASAGFSHRLLLEYNRDACRTLRRNQAAFGPKCHVHEGDVHSFDFRQLRGVSVLGAGAPCQPFSIAGKHRTHEDERNLFPEVFRAVRELRPQAVVIENVKGLLRHTLSDFVDFIELQLAHPEFAPKSGSISSGWADHLVSLRRLHRTSADKSDLQYVVRKQLLNSADFGTPQRRERVFFVAIRRDLGVAWTPPKPTHSSAALRLAQEVTGTYWERHGIKRRVLSSHPRAGEWLREAGERASWVTVRDALAGLPDPSGGAQTLPPNHIAQPGARSYPGHTGSPMDVPAKTLKAGVHGVPGGENMLRRPNGTVRYFTVREAARLQTFPDSYEFTGAWGEAMRQIGNAVPVKLASAVAQSIRICLEEASRPTGLRRIGGWPPEPVQGELAELLTNSV